MELSIIFKEIEFDVEFDYQPEEPMVRYYSDGSGYPGCPANIDGINSITHKGTDFIPFFDEVFNNWEEQIEELLWEAMSKYKSRFP